MVQTKTEKRKAAARTVARAVQEKSKEKKGEKKPAERAKAMKANNASMEIDEDETTTTALDLSSKVAKIDKVEQDEDLSGDEDEFTSQRLVVRLTPRNEEKLNRTLKSISSKPETQSKSSEQQVSKADQRPSLRKSSVVYVGRIPHGFFENQMRGYFSQFGDVKRIRVSRNKKTGKSKHYAFIEFVHPEVAEIVADTHNNMLMCDRMIKCNVVPLEKVHDRMWDGIKKTINAESAKLTAKKTINRKRTKAEEESRLNHLVSQENKKRRKLEAAGIEYDFPGYQGLRDAQKPKRTKFAE